MLPDARTRRLPIFLILASSIAAMAVHAKAPEKVYLSYQGERSIGISQDFLNVGDFKQALLHAEQATRSDPKSGIAETHKAMVLEKMNHQQKANQAYNKALKLSPNDGYVLNAVARNICQRGKSVEADALFVRAVQDVDYAIPQQALQNAGACALKAGNIQLSELRFRSALMADPEAIESLEALSEIKFKQEKFFEARAFMQRREALGALTPAQLQLAYQIEKAAGDDRAASKYQKQLTLLSQAPTQPPTGEGQKQP